MNDQNDPPIFPFICIKIDSVALSGYKIPPNYYIPNPSVLIGVRGKEQDSVPLPTYFCSEGLLLQYVLKHR